ncbi:MAG: NAD(P)H-quinone oxidoreductase subunit 3 [candidate division BRC1 bacterium ADurb.BinA292]|nr:MAG: NAD(P)H-quinone oxidoreductase subunit 3 [candidate division BRC1 bacterium ADurb.BinA292]
MLTQFAAVLVFTLVGIVFVFGNLLLGWLARPRQPSAEKETIYECGEPTIGSAWIRFNSRFYTVALVYLLFDVEVVVLIPAMMVFREVAGGPGGAVALIGLLAFLGLLVLGLAYEWHYGNLDWIRRTDEEPGGEPAAELAAPVEGARA